MNEKPRKGGIAGRRKPIDTAVQRLVTMGEHSSPDALPLVMRPAVHGIDLIEWIAANRAYADALLHLHGALLFRGFNLRTADDLERFIGAASGTPMAYTERSSPRSAVGRNIYTSTEYPADRPIFPHNENSYAHIWPLRIFFLCVSPASRGGGTPLADCRSVLARIPAVIRDSFVERGVLYLRTFTPGLGVSWQTVFQTDDRARLGDDLARAGYSAEWLEGGGLGTRRIGPAVLRHPHTGEAVWFNHAAFFHISTLEPDLQADLLEQCGEERLPTNTRYGDGAPIDASVAGELRDAYRDRMRFFQWEPGDLLMVDNMLVAHGREPFHGDRKILVGMSIPCHLRDGSVRVTTDEEEP
ncbi:MAG TPA: TauD/TfdA family dioxygenase [Candidatus Kapabacteria bacterium]|nr:TauD/TfdA family dioxygenase [Candidatus Kapabacteria bacterium]